MIYSISDLHLDYTGNKTMELFGENWDNYENRIFQNWKEVVKDNDIVLIAGDISWAMTINEAYNDLIRIENLPGKKVLIKGNHDYWWSSLKKINDLNLNNMFFLQNNSYDFNGISIVGTRGWEDCNEDSDEFNVFKRELLRLEMSIKTAKTCNKKIAMLHYPPFDKKGIPNDFHSILKKYNIEICIYGHLHGPGLSNIIEGTVDGIKYFCTSSDYLNFIPKLIY
ncbi:metallophosphoesterase [Miniphocaeibacter halophilus]|uniref:Metallophosphoesterase n=1 Tax=Miniphocaeibacter halophilus TaxID=2931922 RepID=A0AC61MQ09_9FIRM|nr:metallophosphoesterase [Miniphocaeibacter halophilus]QQK07707.1 metallophosphoesterase [Miniphocaeibacter halophilus]